MKKRQRYLVPSDNGGAFIIKAVNGAHARFLAANHDNAPRGVNRIPREAIPIASEQYLEALEAELCRDT